MLGIPLNRCYTVVMDISQWYRETVQDDSINAAAARAGIQQTTLNRQVRSGKFTAETVVALARGYRVDIIEALVTLGLFTYRDLRLPSLKATLADATDQDIVDEVARRIARTSETHEALDEPITLGEKYSAHLSPVPDTPDLHLAAAPEHDERESD